MLLKIIGQRIFIYSLKKIKHITNDMYTITNTSCGVTVQLQVQDLKFFTYDAIFKDTDSLEGTACK